MRWRVGRSTVLSMAAAALVAGCASGAARSTDGATDPSGPSRAEFVSRLEERDRLRPVEAECVADYVFEAYEPDVLADLLRAGLDGVDMTQWPGYGHAMVACAFADDLGIPIPADPVAR